MPPPTEKPILFHYDASIYSHRVLWYLWLRGIPYSECIQPPYMPRPDLASLGVNYRRIPILAIGKDIYIDSRLILRTLESLYPNSILTPKSPFSNGVRALLENWTIDGGIFANAVKCIPYWHADGMLTDPKFVEDRAGLMGGVKMTGEMMEAGRGSGLQHLTVAFELLEQGILADGREWVLGGDEGLTTADIDAVWPFEWLVVDERMRGSLDRSQVGRERFPRVWAWVERFVRVVEGAKGKVEGVERLDGKGVEERVRGSKMQVKETKVEGGDPLGLLEGDEVEVFPADYGQSHKDRGALVGLTSSEVVIRNEKGYHLHFPRWGFNIRKVSAASIPAAIRTAKKIPKMKLLYHNYSPYTRKVFMVALEHGLERYINLQKVVICPVPFPGWSDNNDEVSVYNPMTKIPCLIPEDLPDGVFDSRIICEYLENLAGVSTKKDDRHFQLRTLHACADGIMDAGVLIAYEKHIREGRGAKLDEWYEGQQGKMLRGLDRLQTAVTDGLLQEPPKGTASSDELAVVAAVSFADQMEIEWRNNRPKLVEWYTKWQARRSYQMAPVDKDWTAGDDLKVDSKM